MVIKKFDFEHCSLTKLESFAKYFQSLFRRASTIRVLEVSEMDLLVSIDSYFLGIGSVSELRRSLLLYCNRE